MATSLSVPTTGMCSCSLNLPHWYFLLSMCYPLKNHMWLFSGQHTDSKKIIGREQVCVFQTVRFARIDFPTVNVNKWKTFQVFFIKTEHLKFSLDSNYFAGACIQMVNEITTVVFNFSILKIIMQFLFLHISKYFRIYCNWPVYFIVLSLW
jgi:hypothetical protein